MNACFSISEFNNLSEIEKDKYLEKNFFFCSVCKHIFNLHLIKIKAEYNKKNTYYSLFKCYFHNHKKYPPHYE